jgi:hypothetical protein
MMQQEQASHPGASGSASAPVLSSLPPHTQQFYLMRDLLQVLSGVEGQYIRVAAAVGTGPGGSETGLDASQPGDAAARQRRSDAALSAAIRNSQNGGAAAGLLQPKVSDAHFLIDLDTADRSVANQVSALCSQFWGGKYFQVQYTP